MSHRHTLAMFALSITLPSCLATGMYRTAHILPENEGDFGLNFSFAKIKTDSVRVSDGQGGTTKVGGDEFQYPNLIPEVSYHFGLAKDVEIGGRVVLGAGLAEFDTKYRFVGGDGERLHLAIQPALGYHAFGWVNGLRASLPLILTYDLSDHIALNTAAFGSYTHLEVTDSFDSDDFNMGGETALAGGAIGVSFVTKSGFYIMPGIEVQRSVYHGGDFDDAPDFTYMILGVSLGWGPNPKLDQINTKLDRVNEKLDRIQDGP